MKFLFFCYAGYQSNDFLSIIQIFLKSSNFNIYYTVQVGSMFVAETERSQCFRYAIIAAYAFAYKRINVIAQHAPMYYSTVANKKLSPRAKILCCEYIGLVIDFHTGRFYLCVKRVP